MTLKRNRKLRNKPGSEDSVSDEVITRTLKKAKGTKSKPEGSDLEDKTMEASKSSKAKGKKPLKITAPSDESATIQQKPEIVYLPQRIHLKPLKITASSHESDSEEPTQPKTRGNTKKLQISEPVSSVLTDPQDDSKPVKKGKVKKRVLRKPEPANVSSDESETEEKPQPTKRVKGKKVLRKVELMQKASDNIEAESKTLKSSTVKGKKAIVSTAAPRVSTDSDTEEKVPSKLSKGKEKSKPKEANKDNASDDEFSTDVEQDSEAPFNQNKHKENLKQLQRIDPDFYKFLQEHDTELLEFDEDEEGLEENDDDDAKDEKMHVPGALHGDSDESDFENDEAPIKGKVTLQMVKEWESQLRVQTKIKVSTFTHVVKLFHAAVLRATSEDGTTDSEYKVAGSSVFNAVLNMCVLHLPASIKKYLGVTAANADPRKCKHFVKIKGILIQYLTDLLKLLSVVTSDNILNIMLKHLHQMSRFVACFTRIAKRAIKKLLPLWSSGEETVRVLAFICILRITRNQQQALLTPVLKTMFMMYVKNCKFVSPTTWPGINFMRRSLVEMYSLDLDVSYPLVFLYVRQLGIHLRNAIVVPKLEHRLAVYNWQYINSLHLWAELLQQSTRHPEMESLFFPLSMIVSNTIKLVPTAQYYPVRFYLIEVLMNMTRESGIFVPVLGFFLDVITKFDFNKKHKKVSMKPLDFSCIIRLSKSQMNENGFKDTVVDKLYALLLEFMAFLSNSIAFPDIVVILIVMLKDTIGKCSVPNFAKKLKQLTDKIEENAQHIRKAREVYDVSLVNLQAIRGWEAKRRAEGTPLMNYFESWSKVNKIQKRKIATKNDELAGQLPFIKRPKIGEETKIMSFKPTTLFSSDSEDDAGNLLTKQEPTTETKTTKAKKRKKNRGSQTKTNPKTEHTDSNVADAGDIVKEFSVKDW